LKTALTISSNKEELQEMINRGAGLINQPAAVPAGAGGRAGGPPRRQG